MPAGGDCSALLRDESQRASADSSIWPVAAICSLLLLAIFLVFGPAIGHDFVNYDDDQYVYKNPPVTSGLTIAGAKWAFTCRHASNWHPLTWLSHTLDCQFYGLSPWGHHLTNVLLHAATAIVLFLILRRMTGDFWPSAFAAALFAVHPLRVESVAWVAERKDVLSGLFFMLTVGAYLGYVRHPSSLTRYLAVLVLFVLGLMAKPMLVTLPLVLLLLDYWPLGRMALPPRPDPAPPCPLSLWEWVRVRAARQKTSALNSSCHPQPSPAAPLPKGEGSFSGMFLAQWRLIFEKLPLLVLSAASCAVTLWAQSNAIAAAEQVPLAWRLGNAAVSYVVYLSQSFWPSGLAVLYPHPGLDLPPWKIAAALLILATICGIVVALRRRCPYLLVGWFWYVGMLLPVIGVVQVGLQAHADRYTYLPQIGLVIALAWATKCLVGHRPRRAWACAVAAALALAALMGCAWRQTAFWRDSEALWTRALDCTSNNSIAENDLGVFLHDQGRDDEAIAHCRKALEIAPRYAEAYSNLGVALRACGKLDEALACYRLALEIKPDLVDAHINLGNALMGCGQSDEATAFDGKMPEAQSDHADSDSKIGATLVRDERVDEALYHYHEAARIRPDYVWAHFHLARALVTLGLTDGAIVECRRTLALDPNLLAMYGNLARMLVDRGQPDEAISLLGKALQIKADQPHVRYNLGLVLCQQGRLAEAMEQWAEVLRWHPENTEALNQVAWVRATAPEASVRDGAKAVEMAQHAVKLTDGQEPNLLDTLAAAQAEAGQFGEAVETAKRALALASGHDGTALADGIRARIRLYEAGTPYRETRPPSRLP